MLGFRASGLGSVCGTLGGEHIATVGDAATREAPSQFMAPHVGVAVDSRGDIYVGEVSRTSMRKQVAWLFLDEQYAVHAEAGEVEMDPGQPCAFFISLDRSPGSRMDFRPGMLPFLSSLRP